MSSDPPGSPHNRDGNGLSDANQVSIYNEFILSRQKFREFSRCRMSDDKMTVHRVHGRTARGRIFRVWTSRMLSELRCEAQALSYVPESHHSSDSHIQSQLKRRVRRMTEEVNKREKCEVP